MKIEHVVFSETSFYIKGRSYEVSETTGSRTWLTDWLKSKEDLWFIGQPKDVLERIGVTTSDAKRANDLINLFDGDVRGFYYVVSASPEGSEEAIKWILGGLAAHLNEKGISFDNVQSVLPSDYLRAFCEYLESGKLNRTFAKDVFAEILTTPRFEEHLVYDESLIPFGVESWDDHENYRYARTRRISGQEIMERIIADPRFKVVDSSEIDLIIDKVLADNPVQAEKVKTDPKLIQFFVGQVMKSSKGRSPALVVQQKLKERFGA